MQTGNIYNYYNKGKKMYTALQIVKTYTEKQEYLLLALNYWDEKPLTAADLSDIKPFWKDHHSWNGEFAFMLYKGYMPDNYSLAGNTEVLCQPGEEPTQAGSWNYSCLQISLQKAWEELPKSFRDAYKQLKGRGSNVPADRMTAINNGAEFDAAYPAPTKIEVDGDKRWLIDYISTHHNITELVWENNTEKVIDLSATRLTSFRTDGKGIEKIILNDSMDELCFLEPISKEIKIVAAPKNCTLDLHLENTNNLHLFSHLNINELWISAQNTDGKTDIDMGEIARHLPRLRVLRIWGKPSYIVNMKEIASLSRLSWLTLRDVFGFTAADFPARKDFAHINCIWMDSIPDDVAKKVKKEYKEKDLWITKGRKPEWLGANLNNPFRHWDGDEHIFPAHAKKATNLYIKIDKQVRTLIDHKHPAQQLQAEMETIVTDYVKEFNKIDRRTQWIDTMYREDILDAMTKFLEPVKEAYGNAINYNKLDEIFENEMDF